ncbi:SIS domain-containing protein [Bacillus thuringiensis]|uniref:SIS domain-containing protein n=1 Tax=Bacillus thuringiensis TaxID=1428 RepID=UPI00333C0794
MEDIIKYFDEMKMIIQKLDYKEVEKMINILVKVREDRGRVFFIGVGGGAGHSSHAVCDFRKLVGVEAYTPLDNVSELTAQANDNGWEWIFSNWLKESHLNKHDCIFVFSVGGGDLEFNISPNICRALEYSSEIGSSIIGIVGREGGYTAQVADACVVVPTVNECKVTPHVESFQAVIWHLLVSHPRLQKNDMKWEGVQNIKDSVDNVTRK